MVDSRPKRDLAVLAVLIHAPKPQFPFLLISAPYQGLIALQGVYYFGVGAEAVVIFTSYLFWTVDVFHFSGVGRPRYGVMTQGISPHCLHSAATLKSTWNGSYSIIFVLL